MEVTLGGDRLGSGNKMGVNLHGFDRATFNQDYVWRTTMSAGTLVPFMVELGTNGTTFDINLDVDVKTHPTVGPLFGSMKFQGDIFIVPIRLYNSLLHNNALNIGRDISQVKFPTIRLFANKFEATNLAGIDNEQVNKSCVLNYMGIAGLGNPNGTNPVAREFNAVPLLGMYDIYKNYYANKQEEIGAVLHTPYKALVETVTEIAVISYGASTVVPEAPGTANIDVWPTLSVIDIKWDDGVNPEPLPEQISIRLGQSNELFNLGELSFVNIGGGILRAQWTQPADQIINWQYIEPDGYGMPKVQTFPLANIDTMRERILAWSSKSFPFNINSNVALPPYNYLYEANDGVYNITRNQEGLLLKTYQSDVFNNWISTEWIDGEGGINDITRIDTSEGYFNIDAIVLGNKVYNMLNRIAISGGSYNDWQEVQYESKRFRHAETPMFAGGISREIVFQEVVSTMAGDAAGIDPLGSLAGRGVMARGQKGGHIVIKLDEPSYIMGFASITPRIDYSQGNRWFVNLKTMADIHVPSLDGIGFQELITEQMAYWDTYWDNDNLRWVTRSAGKQTAWINYQTNYNRTYGNFALPEEMYMTNNRRYEVDDSEFPMLKIKDLTTYIDPAKFNYIFAETARDAQNYWVQMGVDIKARRKMSAKIMPNL